MNGDDRKIEIFKPFGEAYELTKKILFQPFDLKKWCVIGFAAFLASLSGGMHFNFNGFNRKQDWHWKFSSMRHNMETTAGHMPGWVIPLVIVLVLLVLALVVVLMWLGARGRFMFVDCIVHDRGAIKAPWREFRTEGNSFFLFSLLVVLIFFLVVVLALLGLFLPKILHADVRRLRLWLIAGLISVVALVVVLALGWHWISQLMVPVMYRKRCRALPAFRDVLGLISNHPAPLILYFLFFIVLALASIVIGCVTACLTCCVAVIPYVGTVILLPLHVLLYGFTLLFLRQFGPDYDVWTGLTPAMEAGPTIPPTPPPPLQG
jgi:hypothetical protein